MIKTSYYANVDNISDYNSISVSRVIPKWSSVTDSYLDLAPSKELLNGYKNNTITKEEFVKIYNKQLSKLDVHKVYKDLDNRTLVGYGALSRLKSTFSPRHLISQWFRDNGYMVVEMVPKNPMVINLKVQKVDKLDKIKCMKNKNCIYVFGDNLIRKGKDGQAVIRDCDNSFGIATKRLPSMKKSAFFSDLAEELELVEMDFYNLLHKVLMYDKTIIYPKDGIGTGRAKLEEKSPAIKHKLDYLLKTWFKV